MVPKSRLVTKGDCAFAISAPLWNSLPGYVRLFLRPIFLYVLFFILIVLSVFCYCTDLFIVNHFVTFVLKVAI